MVWSLWRPDLRRIVQQPCGRLLRQREWEHLELVRSPPDRAYPAATLVDPPALERDATCGAEEGPPDTALAAGAA